MDPNTGRRRHYGEFYRTPGSTTPEDLPLWLVIGNCQAEALRQVLDAVPGRPYRTVRVPPVHELERGDLGYLDALLARTAVLISQPIRNDYRDLPLGTAQLAQRLPSSAVCIRWPVIRYAGLYPFQVIVRHPADRSVVPPVVPYHDLRTIAAARAGLAADAPWDVEVTADQLRAVAFASRDDLAAREKRNCDIGVSDLLIGYGAEAAHTINHPGNPILEELGQRVLGHTDVTLSVSPVGATLLGSVSAPLEPRVLAALDIDAASRSRWLHHGDVIDAGDVHTAQLAWYAANPGYLDLAVARHGATMEIVGLLDASRWP